MREKTPNKLIHEKSPYLLQHAYNPVDWYPWGEDAFKKAKKEDKPIFCSIGYSTCHWCHVMEKESFENPEVADLLNKTFVCIKVDREERPDIDSIYMSVCQMLTGSGGWPLTIVMTPEKKPFFAATYIPRESRFGLTGMLELVPQIHSAWINRRKEISDSADEIFSALQVSRPRGEALESSVLESAYRQLVSQFDEEYGGFGTAPKFSMPTHLLFLLRYWKRTREEKALEMVEKTLKALKMGGIWDHIGFGFHRYSTDRVWLVPHFEKMLYDQALLAFVYTEAFQATKNFEYKKTAQEIFEYIVRDMTSPEGGFYSAEDADSEGEEGKFYTWSEQEIVDALDDPDVILKGFNVSREGNFSEPGRIPAGKNVLHQEKPLSERARELDISCEELNERVEKARRILFEVRENRVHPQKDDKILTNWNGLMIAALSKGAQVFREPRYSDAAGKAADFIIDTMVTPFLYHRYREGEVDIPGFLDDYAFFVWGLLELYEATFEVTYLKTAITLTDDMITHFWDVKEGGFFYTSDESEKVLVRQKQFYDGVTPSGTSVAMLNLLHLARTTGNTEYEEKALQLSQVGSETVKHIPSSHTFLMTALDFAAGPSFEIVIVGRINSPDTKEMITALRSHFIPNKVVIFRPDEKSPEITGLSPFTKDMTSISGKATAYVCRNFTCNLPTTDVDTMLEQLNELP